MEYIGPMCKRLYEIRSAGPIWVDFHVRKGHAFSCGDPPYSVHCGLMMLFGVHWKWIFGLRVICSMQCMTWSSSRPHIHFVFCTCCTIMVREPSQIVERFCRFAAKLKMCCGQRSDCCVVDTVFGRICRLGQQSHLNFIVYLEKTLHRIILLLETWQGHCW